jgi:predicted transcriptional regulator
MNYDELIDEEIAIANEQDHDDTVLHANVFKTKIVTLGLGNPLYVNQDSSLATTIDIMRENRVGSIMITDANNQVVGIFTERDILNRVIGKVENTGLVKVSEYMTKDPETLHANDLICFALNNMHVGGYRNIPILNEDGTPYTLLNVQDILDFILDFFPNEITNILSQPYTGVHLRESA